jgi:hypothetical protein
MNPDSALELGVECQEELADVGRPDRFDNLVRSNSTFR